MSDAYSKITKEKFGHCMHTCLTARIKCCNRFCTCYITTFLYSMYWFEKLSMKYLRVIYLSWSWYGHIFSWVNWNRQSSSLTYAKGTPEGEFVYFLCTQKSFPCRNLFLNTVVVIQCVRGRNKKIWLLIMYCIIVW